MEPRGRGKDKKQEKQERSTKKMKTDNMIFCIWAACGVIAPFVALCRAELTARRIEAAEAALDLQIERERLMLALIQSRALWR